MEEKYATFLAYYAYYFKKGKNATERKRFVQCMEEGAVTDWTC